MILPDVNILVHAYNRDSPWHEPARDWWVAALSGTTPVALAWVVLLGFLRITTHRTILANPWRANEALEHVEEWLRQPNVRILHPTSRHPELLAAFLRRLGTAGNLTTDAHLAALALEHHCTLYTTDADFARFPGISIQNPLHD